jgi:hypothetical protein
MSTEKQGGFSISIDKPLSVGCVHNLIKSQANDEMYFVTRWTIKGYKFNTRPSFNVPDLKAFDEAKSVTDFNNASAFKGNVTVTSSDTNITLSNVTILEVGIDGTSTYAAQDQIYYVICEETKELIGGENRISQILSGLTPTDIKNIDNVSASETIETNSVGKVKTLEVKITSIRDGITKTKAESIASAFFNNQSSGGGGGGGGGGISETSTAAASGERITYGSSYDELVKTYTFIKTTTTYKNNGKIKSNSFNIQNDGSIIGTQNLEMLFPSDESIDKITKDIKNELKNGENELKSFVTSYYGKGYDTLPSNYSQTFYLQNISFNVDEAAGKAQGTVTITNLGSFSTDVQLNISTIKETNTITEESTKTIRGTIIGIKEPPSSETDLSNNKKLNKAKSYFDANYLKDFKEAASRNKIKEGNEHGMITNGSINYNISEGSISFGLTYNYGPKYQTKTQSVIFGSAEGSQAAETHLINKFLVVGPNGAGGEELIQQTDQSNPIENNIRLNILLKDGSSCKTYVTSDLKNTLSSLIKSTDVIKNIDINYDLIGATVQAQASWLSYGAHRTFGDLSQKASGISISL